MDIQADKEGLKAIQQLCDVALRSNGLNDLNGINTIINSASELKEKESPKKEEKKSNKVAKSFADSDKLQ